MSRRRIKLLLAFCALLFVAAVWGSVDCGLRLAQAEDGSAAETHLRRLIYFHFGVAQLAALAACVLLYLRHRRWRKFYLLVSYNERGLTLDPPGIRMPSRRVCRCCLGKLAEADLPPAGAPVLVYPMFMQSGQSSGAKLEHELAAAYAARGIEPTLYYQPVLGASPWLARAAVQSLRPLLEEMPGRRTGILVVAHGSRLPEPPPEPALFCRRLRDLLPGVEVVLGYFGQQPMAADQLRALAAEHVLLLPFLLTEGVHTARDLPTEADAAACGKTLRRLPVAAALLNTPPMPHSL